MKKVLFYDEMIILPDEFLAEYRIFKFSAKDLTNSDLVGNRCNILLSRSTLKVNEKLLENVPLEYYATATAGFDHVDLDYLDSRGIKYLIASGSNANSVAEYVLINIERYVKRSALRFEDLEIGIIGFGNIGRKVAYYCHLLGMKIYVSDPPLQDGDYPFPDDYHITKLDNLLKNVNIITNHVPLISYGKYKTVYLLGENLNLVRRNALFVHTSRGKVVDEANLIRIAKEKELSLAIDVWQNEPNVSKELIAISRIATPHIAGHSHNAKLNASQMILNDLFAKGLSKQTYIIGNRHGEDTKESDIIEKLELARIRRKINEDSITLKQHPELFLEIRKNYPPCQESLFTKE